MTKSEPILSEIDRLPRLSARQEIRQNRRASPEVQMSRI
jgi:hypothetical protein